MPLWKVYHPAGAYTAQDKKDLSERITGMYARVPTPKFYVVRLCPLQPPSCARKVTSTATT